MHPRIRSLAVAALMTFGALTATAPAPAVAASPTTTSLSSPSSSVVVGQTVTLTVTVAPNPGAGNVRLIDNNVDVGLDFPIDAATGTASIDRSFLAGTHTLYAQFQGNAGYTGSTSPSIIITASLVATTTSVSSSANPTNAGNQVTLTATVSPNPGGGDVRFIIGGTYIGYTTPIGSNGQAQLAWSFGAGSTNVVAEFLPFGSLAGSSSSTLVQVARYPTTTALTSSALTATRFETTVRFTATVSPWTADGNVLFYDGATSIARRPLVNGIATLDLNSLAVGSNTIRAKYQGSAYLISGSRVPSRPRRSSPIVGQNSERSPSKYANLLSWSSTLYPRLDPDHWQPRRVCVG